MNPSTVQATMHEQSKKCIAVLNKYKSDFENALSDFLTSSQKNCLLIETKDSTRGAIRIMQFLEHLKANRENEKALGRYLSAENQTFVHWDDVLRTAGMAKELPKFTDLLVCMIPDRESVSIEILEEEVLHIIKCCLKIGNLKKIVFIATQKGVLDEYLQEIDVNAFVKIDELENDIPSLINDEKRALLNRASCGDSNGVEQLLKIGVNVNTAYGEDELSALHVAAEKGHKEVVLTLLRYGAAILPNKSGDTPLHKAAQEGHSDVVSVLLDKSVVDVDVRGEVGQTALYDAAEAGHRDVIQILINHRANVNAQNSGVTFRPLHSQCNNTALHVAANYGHKDIVQILLENGAAIDIVGSNEETALHHAALYNRMDVVEILLEKGANLEPRDIIGETPLHKAVLFHGIEAVITLLNNGADVNAKDNTDNTALHKAAFSGNVEMVNVLIERGVNVHDQNHYGETALDASLKGRHRVFELLFFFNLFIPK